MRSRCRQATGENAKWYFNRGIVVCDEWEQSFESFAEWALTDGGFAPDLTLDRIDNDGNYEPGNCRFVTCAQNCRNRSTTKLNVDSASQVKTLLLAKVRMEEIASRFGVSTSCINEIRIGKNWKDVSPILPVETEETVELSNEIKELIATNFDDCVTVEEKRAFVSAVRSLLRVLYRRISA